MRRGAGASVRLTVTDIVFDLGWRRAAGRMRVAGQSTLQADIKLTLAIYR